MHFAVSLKETLACLVDALVTLGVIFSDGTRVDRNQSDTGMMVPASGASGFYDNLCNCNVCRTSPAFHFDALVLGFELPERCSRYWGWGSPLSRVASAAPTNTARTVTAIATGNIAPASIRFLWSYGAYANRQR